MLQTFRKLYLTQILMNYLAKNNIIYLLKSKIHVLLVAFGIEIYFKILWPDWKHFLYQRTLHYFQFNTIYNACIFSKTPKNHAFLCLHKYWAISTFYLPVSLASSHVYNELMQKVKKYIKKQIDATFKKKIDWIIQF